MLDPTKKMNWQEQNEWNPDNFEPKSPPMGPLTRTAVLRERDYSAREADIAARRMAGIMNVDLRGVFFFRPLEIYCRMAAHFCPRAP